MTACDQITGVALRSIDVDGKTNEITRFAPLLEQISDLHHTVITTDAPHCQREHVTYPTEHGAHWIPTRQRQPTPPARPTHRTGLAGSPGHHPRHRPRTRPPRDPHPEDADDLHRHRLPARRPSHPDPPPQTAPYRRSSAAPGNPSSQHVRRILARHKGGTQPDNQLSELSREDHFVGAMVGPAAMIW
ncbi:hypothetical protein [Plantactinospora sp. DSM 117369]